MGLVGGRTTWLGGSLKLNKKKDCGWGSCHVADAFSSFPLGRRMYPLSYLSPATVGSVQWGTRSGTDPDGDPEETIGALRTCRASRQLLLKHLPERAAGNGGTYGPEWGPVGGNMPVRLPPGIPQQSKKKKNPTWSCEYVPRQLAPFIFDWSTRLSFDERMQAASGCRPCSHEANPHMLGACLGTGFGSNISSLICRLS